MCDILDLRVVSHFNILEIIKLLKVSVTFVILHFDHSFTFCSYSFSSCICSSVKLPRGSPFTTTFPFYKEIFKLSKHRIISQFLSYEIFASAVTT